MKIICERISMDRYAFYNYYGSKHDRLLFFLDEEIRDPQTCQEWVDRLVKKNHYDYAGDLFEYVFTDDELHIYSGELGNDDPNEIPYTINKNVLIELIKIWADLIYKRVNRIIIEEVNHKLIIYGEDWVNQINASLDDNKLSYIDDSTPNRLTPLFNFLNNEIPSLPMIETWIQFIQYGKMGKTKKGTLMEIFLRGELAIITYKKIESEKKTYMDFFDIERVNLIKFINEWHTLRSKKSDAIIIEEFQTNVKIYPLSLH